MMEHDSSYKRFQTLVRKHELTIKKKCGLFHPSGSYGYKSMVCDLTTYLWLVYRDLPPNKKIHNEEAWVFVVLLRKANNLYRNEKRYQDHLTAELVLNDMDIPQPERDPMVERLYSLIRHLDDDEQEMILLYLDHYNMVQIAEITNQSYLNTVRRKGRIRKKLRLLNQQLDEED